MEALDTQDTVAAGGLGLPREEPGLDLRLVFLGLITARHPAKLGTSVVRGLELQVKGRELPAWELQA